MLTDLDGQLWLQDYTFFAEAQVAGLCGVLYKAAAFG
jgi:hypothetical protein